MRFEFIRTLGSGATGVVELHRDKERNAFVALKRLHPHLNFTPGNETALALTVTHRNVCRVHDVHREGGVTVISMEYVDGETLRAVIQRSAPMAIDEVLKIFRQIIAGVEEAHAQGVIHCDLKPENVMVGRDGVVKIMDFGLAMRLPLTVGLREQSREMAGTPGYMAPEQAEGRNDKRTDIYMLGGLLYEMTTGMDARNRPLSFPDGLPDRFRSLILKCSTKNPARRFQSVAELRNALVKPDGGRPSFSYRGMLAACLLLGALGLAVMVRPHRKPAVPVTTGGAAYDRSSPENRTAVPPVQPDAAKLLSDGEYFLQSNLVDDALAAFDRALQIDGNLTEAHFQRGLALVKLKKWDDAITSLKRALPDSASGRHVIWEWSPNFAPSSTHGVIWARPNRVLYGERQGKDTILQLIDLEQHRVRRLQIPDGQIRLNDAALANDRMTVVMSADLRPPSSGRVRLYAVSAADASLLWHIDLDGYGTQFPWVVLGMRGLLTYLPGKHVLAFYDEGSPQPRWTRADLLPNPAVPSVGLADVVVLNENTTNGTRYHAVNMADKTDAWTLDLPEFATSVAPARDGDVVYFVSKQSEVFAVNVGGGAGRVLWHTPVGKTVVSLRAGAGQLYAGTAGGDLRMLDARTGEVSKTLHLDSGALSVDYAGSDRIVASSATAVHGVINGAAAGAGSKNWEYPSRYPAKNVKVVDGIVLARTAEDEIAALNAETGALLWQHNGPLVADGVFATGTGVFIADDAGVKQYSTEKPSGKVTNQQVLLEVAAALLNKGDAADASAFAAKIEHELDPASPGFRLLRARLSLAEEKVKGRPVPLKAGADLAAFATASGLMSEASRPVIADLKSSFGLLWVQPAEAALPGAPVRVGRWLVNLGPGNAANMQIVALNPETGEPAWRQPAQRFVDGVAGTADTAKHEQKGEPDRAKHQENIFYVTGDNRDPTVAILRRIDAATGEAIDIASWNGTQPVVLGRIAFASGRLFVLIVSLNPQTRLPEVAVNGFDAASGRQLWPARSHESSPLVPIGLFMPQGDALIYSAGPDIWNIRGADGVVLDHQREKDTIGPNISHTPVPNGPIYYVTSRREISAYDTAGKQITNSPRPEIDSPQLTVREGMLFGTDKGSVYGFDLHSGLKWQIPPADGAKFLNFQDAGKSLWALRDDNVLVAIDRATGKVLNSKPMLWRPAAYTISAGRLYAFTADGLAYALQVNK